MTRHPVACGKCGARFPSVMKLTAHIRKKHPGEQVSAIIDPKEKEDA